ncbi:MAG: FAD-dependent oxidoreductase [Candidatus Nezhaarchaeales archaeon]
MEDEIMEIYESPKKLDVLASADVIVCGGGPAGIGAALASARNGAKTILLEKFNSLGGLQTQGNNPIFTFVDPALHGGIIIEILKRLREAGALRKFEEIPPYERGRMKSILISLLGKDRIPKRVLETDVGWWGAWGVTFDLEYYKLLLDTLMDEAGVKTLYHTLVVDVLKEENELRGVIVETPEGRKAILGKVVIDTTGTGLVAWKSGAACMGDEGIPVGKRKGQYPGTLIAFFVGGVDYQKFVNFRLSNPEQWGQMYCGMDIVKKAKEKGAYIKHDALVCATIFDVYNAGRVYVMGPVYAFDDKPPWSVEELTNAEKDMRKQVWAIFKVLKENVPGFEKAYVERTPAYPVLSGHRIVGKYVITVGDMREGRAFEDSVAINNMPPDIFELVGRFGYEILPHDIPYRALVSKDIPNLLAAGTVISAGLFAIGGLRYCTPSICTGQAAGTAAALSIKTNVSPTDLDVTLLQDTLRKQGVIVSVKEVPPEALEPYRVIKSLGLVFKRREPDVPEEEIAKY